jgi:2',3'-cyclic-nucleotide 2'-phosphodiesterase
VLVDFHAERIVEKRTFAHAIDGRAALVVGTHTHEPTLLLERFPGGTFFVGDAGMCGPSRGVVGMGPDYYVRRMRNLSPRGFTLADGPLQIGAVLLDVAAGRIERFLPASCPDYEDC